MSSYPDFEDGAIVVTTEYLNGGDGVVIHAGFVGQVQEQDGPWVMLNGVDAQWMSKSFRRATDAEAAAFRAGMAPSTPLRDTSNPMRPYVLYGAPFPLGADLVAAMQPALATDPLQTENQNLLKWLEDERRVVLDLRRQLAAAQDENAELRAGLGTGANVIYSRHELRRRQGVTSL